MYLYDIYFKGQIIILHTCINRFYHFSQTYPKEAMLSTGRWVLKLAYRRTLREKVVQDMCAYWRHRSAWWQNHHKRKFNVAIRDCRWDVSCFCKSCRSVLLVDTYLASSSVAQQWVEKQRQWRQPSRCSKSSSNIIIIIFIITVVIFYSIVFVKTVWSIML